MKNRSLAWKIPLALVLVLVASEIAARAFLPTKLLLPFVAIDPLLGHKGPPGGDVVIWNNKLRYNERGFRELPLVKGKRAPSGQIAWLGDSMIEAMTIGDYEHFSSQVEAQTGAHGELFAAGDWGTLQELLAFREYGGKAEKLRAVVLGFSSLTDFVNNSPEFASRYQSKMDFLRPYARFENGRMHVFSVRPWYQALRSVSRLFLLFDNARITRSLGSPVRMPSDCKANPNSVPLQAYFTANTPEWESAVLLTAYLLEELKRESTKTRTPFLAVYLPNDFELLDDKWEDTVRGPTEFCYPNQVLGRRENERKFLEAAKKAGVDAVSLYDYFAAEIKKQKGNSIFLDDGHFNPLGHTLFANEMVRQLRQRKIVD